MGFFSDGPPDPPILPPPPPPEEIMDFFDEISGTQAITVKGPDGKKRRVLSKLPPTKEEEYFVQQGEKMMQDTVQNLKVLYQQNPASIVDYAPLVDTLTHLGEERAQDLAQVANIGNIEEDISAFREMQNTILERDFSRINKNLETNLIQKGYKDSTIGQGLRAQLAREEALARQQGDLNARMYGEDLANKRLSRNMNAYGVREQGRQEQAKAAQTAYALEREREEALKARHQEEINRNVAQFQLGAHLKGEPIAKALASKAPELSLQQFALANQDTMNRYNADINRLNSQYRNDLLNYQIQPPSFGEEAAKMAAHIGATMLAGPAGGAVTSGITQMGQPSKAPGFQGYTSSLTPLFEKYK